MDARLISLCSAFAEAYPVVKDYDAAMKLARVQVTLFFTNSNDDNTNHYVDKDDVYYKSLFDILFDKESSLWLRFFSLANVMSKFDTPNGEWKKKFICDFASRLCHIDDCHDGGDECESNATKDTSDNDFIRFFAFVLLQLSTASDHSHVHDMFSTIFDCLITFTYNGNMLMQNPADVSLHHPTLFHILYHVFNSETAQSQLWCVLLKPEFSILEKISVIIFHLPASELRVDVVKLLYSRVVEVMQSVTTKRSEDSAQFFVESWNKIMRPLGDVNDIAVGSIVSCKLIEILINLPATVLNSTQFLDINNELWQILCIYMNHNSSLIRRRGAHIMHKLVLHSQASILGNQYHSKVNHGEKLDKNTKKKKKKSKYDEADNSYVALFAGETVTKSSWPLLFLDVYQQIEGCTSMHLLSQVASWTTCIIFNNL